MRTLLFSLVIIFSIASCQTGASVSESSQVDSLVYEIPGNGTLIFKSLVSGVIQVRYMNDSIPSNAVYAPKDVELVPFTVSQAEDSILLITNSSEVIIDRESHQIKFYNSTGELQLNASGEVGFKEDSTFLRFSIQDDESIYGTGFRALPINRRGEKLLIYNRPQYGYGWGEKNLNYTIPHWTSSAGYGLLIDNPGRAILDIGASDSNTLNYASRGGNLVYYFIPGEDQKELLINYTELTGRQPLPPRWTFGNLQSRFGYRSQKEATSILSKTMTDGYPVDAIILDIYWFGPELEDGQMGRLDWDLNNWPDPKKMIEDFSDQGVKTVVVTEPFFTRKSKHYTYLNENKYLALDSEEETFDIEDFYFGVGGLLDVFKPAASSWMWDQYKYIRSYGVEGLWVDLGEPEKHPDGMQHVNGSADQVHGIYGHAWAEMLYEGYQSDYPEERLFHMGRSGFAGSQRFGLIPWTGDVGRNWNGLRAQIPAILSMGISGLGYMHSDAGGFSMTDGPDPELYIRWLQFSAFSAVFRPHADAMVAPEPVFWDKATQAIVKPLIDWRYALLPYHYTLAYENASTGLPFIRPMMMEFPNVSDTLFQQFMYGSDILVAPVVEQGARSKELFFPEGQWYSWKESKRIEGGQKLVVGAPISKIPVFVKAGSVIPESPGNRHAGDYQGKKLLLSYYLDRKSSESKIYFDDGKDPNAIEEKAYEILTTKVSAEGESYAFSFDRSGTFVGAPDARNITFRIYGVGAQPKNLPVGAAWDEDSSSISFDFQLEDDYSLSLAIQ